MEEKEKKEKVPINFLILSALEEECFAGSTPKRVDNTYIDVKSLLEKILKEQDKKVVNEMLQELLLPAYLRREHGAAIEVVQAARERANSEQYLQFVPPVFGEVGVRLYVNETPAYIELSDLDSHTGMVTPSWKVWVIDQDGKRVDDQSLLESLTIAQEYKNYFTLSEMATGGYRILRLAVSN